MLKLYYLRTKHTRELVYLTIKFVCHDNGKGKVLFAPRLSIVPVLNFSSQLCIIVEKLNWKLKTLFDFRHFGRCAVMANEHANVPICMKIVSAR